LATHRRRASKSGKTSSKPLLLWPFLFFQNFKESATEYSFIIIIIFRILAKFRPKRTKRWSQHLVHKCCAKAILLTQIGIIFIAQHSKPGASQWRRIKDQHLFGGSDIIVTKKFRNIQNFFIAIFQKLKF
jgi:hypothetical protein